MKKIPYQQIQTLFLDAGNTLVSMNFDLICSELKKTGIICEAGELQRAEAAARPVISDQTDEFQTMSRSEIFEVYLRNVLTQLPVELIADKLQIARIARELAPILLTEDKARRLWTYILPGVREALEQFKTKGLQLVVVSNSDGSVEQQLVRYQLRSYFDVVIDSHVVGVAKPDPKIFQIALNRSGADPEKTIHVGDLYDVDIVGARTAGLHAVLLDPYSDWHNVDCERIPDLLALSENITHFTNSGSLVFPVI